MPKMPIEWHRECLKHRNESVRIYERRLKEGAEILNSMTAARDFVLRQITEAERRGLTEFDADRYLVKRPKKVAAAE